LSKCDPKSQLRQLVMRIRALTPSARYELHYMGKSRSGKFE
jgi:hypothetical protein